MDASDFAIYPISFQGRLLRYASTHTLRPIVAGAALLDDAERDVFRQAGDYLFDDMGSGASLSAFNPYWGELSAVYWMLHNAPERVIGHAHYRRRWKDEHIETAQDGVLYVPPAVKLPDGKTLGAQFEAVNYESNQFVRKYTALAEQGVLPLDATQVAAMWQFDHIHPCLMCLGPRESYVRLMTLLFDCLFPFWDAHREEIQAFKGYRSRVIAYLSERVMTGLLANKAYFLGEMPIAYGGMQLAPLP